MSDCLFCIAVSGAWYSDIILEMMLLVFRPEATPSKLKELVGLTDMAGEDSCCNHRPQPTSASPQVGGVCTALTQEPRPESPGWLSRQSRICKRPLAFLPGAFDHQCRSTSDY